MPKKMCKVQIYRSRFCTYHVKANDVTEARTVARKNSIDYENVLSILVTWKEANTVKEIKNE